MADNTKISELDQIQSLSNNDEFMVVDKSVTSGKDASSSGKTTRVTLNQLKEAVSASGAKGAKGDQGPRCSSIKKRSNDGATGATGVGQKGIKGATGDRGQTGQTGAKGATGSKGSTRQQCVFFCGVGASGNSNSHLEWVGVNILQDATGQALRKSGGNGSWANGYAYTNYVLTGGCSVSFKPTATNNSFMVGLTTTTSSTNTTTARYANIDYAFYPHSGGKVRIYEAGARKTDDITTYTPSDLFTITYDNAHVHYYINGSLKRSVSVGSGKRFFAYIAVVPVNKTVTSQFSFVPVGSRGGTGSKGAKGQTGLKGTGGSKGQKGASEVGQKGQKGVRGTSGVFTGGSVASPIKITTTTDEKIILEKSSNPYIRFREGTSNKAYIQWNSNGQLYLVNSETATNTTVANDRFTINSRHGYMQIGAMNSSHAHFYTDRSNFYFNKELRVHGAIKDYSSGSSLL